MRRAFVPAPVGVAPRPAERRWAMACFIAVVLVVVGVGVFVMVYGG